MASGAPLTSASDPQSSPFRPEALAGRVVLVSGGGSGIGFGIARALAGHGARLCLFGRRESVLKQAVHALGGPELAAYSAGDVRRPEDCAAAVAAAVARFGSLDTLVNAAAGNFLSTAEGLPAKGFRTVLEIDTMGTFNLCAAGFEPLRRSGRGVILNVTATLHFAATWYQTHACAAKAGVDAITRQLALEWADYKIRVCGIAPGPIADTPGMLKLSGGATGQEAERRFGKTVPLGRLGSRFDIGMAAVFLCSDGGTFVTGHTLVVDGGEWLDRGAGRPMPREQVAEIAKRVEKRSRALTVDSKL